MARTNRTTTAYDAVGNVTTQADARTGSVRLLTTPSIARPLQLAPLSRTTTAFDEVGNVTEVIDALTRRSTFGYDGRSTGKLSPSTRCSVARPRLSTRQGTSPRPPTHSTARLRTCTTSPISPRPSLTRLAIARPVLMTLSATSRPRPTRSTVLSTYAYDALNRITVMTDALDQPIHDVLRCGGQRHYSNRCSQPDFDLFLRRDESANGGVDPLSNRTTTAYDDVGNATKLTDTLSRVTTVQYDALNRQTAVIDALTNRTTTAYDAVGNVTKVTDVRSNVTSYLYDAVNRQTVVIDALTNRTTTAYDPIGNVTTSTDALNHTASYSYDALTGRPWSSTH